MLVYIAFCALFVVTSCSIVPSSNALNKNSGSKVQVFPSGNQDILSILNPLNGPLNNDERDFEEINNDLDESLPKMTIWQFPREKRTFIGDVEVFIESKEDEVNSHELIDPLDVVVIHPHKRRGLHKTVDEENGSSASKQKSKRDNDEQAITIFENSKQNNNNGGMVKEISKLNFDKRNVNDKSEMETDILHETFSNPSKDRYRRMWEFQDYVKWLLNGWDETTEAGSTNSDTKNKNQVNNDEEKANNNQQDSGNGSLNNINKENSPNKKIEAKVSSDKNNQLQPVNPDLIKTLKEEFSDDKLRGKRSIDSENSINSLVNDNDEDGTNDLFEELLKLLQTGQEFYSMLVTVFYNGA